MENAPNLFNLKELMKAFETSIEINGKWVPARPCGLYSLKNRIVLAFGIFVGKYDAVKWPNQ